VAYPLVTGREQAPLLKSATTRAACASINLATGKNALLKKEGRWNLLSVFNTVMQTL
jgi:hypothetical protein